MLLSDQNYGREHDYHNSCKQYVHATEYELFLKPHHRLDRKSSRGMIYENEELRLRTININAEIERGQYDIKKLKRENELLKKEIWCLRDEYEKLDKLLKDKEIDVSSSSTTSESDSCSSCMDEGDDVEKSQNLENVHKSNLNCLNRAFETLSVVPEESTENSENTSNRTSLVNEQLPHDNDVIQADQSYPSYDQAPTLRLTNTNTNSPKHFFSLDRLVPNANVPYHEMSSIYPNELYENHTIGNKSIPEVQESTLQCTSTKIVHTDASSIYQNIMLVPKKKYSESDIMEKRGTDIIVKTDNRNFLEDHKPDSDRYIAEFTDDFPMNWPNFGTNSHSTFSNGGNLEELLNDIETISQDILTISNTNQSDYLNSNRRCKSDINPMDKEENSGKEKPFKSELNVTLMPQPMTLIGLEKYRDIQRSLNSTPSKSLENLTAKRLHVIYNQDEQLRDNREFHHFQQSLNDVPGFIPIASNQINNFTDIPQPKLTQNPSSPEYFSTLKDNYVNGDYFAKFNSDSFQIPEKTSNNLKNTPIVKDFDIRHEKVRNLMKQVSIDSPSSDNDEKVKSITESEKVCSTAPQNVEKNDGLQPKEKLGLRKKVSIHFRGKKEKRKKTVELPSTSIKKQSPVRDKKIPEGETEEPKNDKLKINHQKTCSKDSNKTTSESDTKNNTDNRKPNENSDNDKKLRKSQSISPDRRKLKEEKKCKKHKKDRMRIRRATAISLDSRDQRGRSHSVNTDRSNPFFYDEYMFNSERDSMSSCETLKTRQMNFTNISIAGKVPWCGCWGNGCI